MTIILGILHGISSGLVVICTQNFFEKLQAVMQSNEFRLSSIVASLLILGGSVILEYILIALHNSEIEKYSFMMDKIFYKRLQDSVKHLGSLTFESKEEVEKVCNAENGAKHATRFINVVCYFICQNSIFFRGQYILGQNSYFPYACSFIDIYTSAIWSYASNKKLSADGKRYHRAAKIM